MTPDPQGKLLELRQEANNAWISLREQQYELKQAQQELQHAQARCDRAHAEYHAEKERQRQEAVSRTA